MNIYLDTNVLLDLYRSPKDALKSFKSLVELGPVIVLPQQTEMEFKRNRSSCLAALRAEVESSIRSPLSKASVLRGLEAYSEWEQAKAAADKAAKKVLDRLDSWSESPEQDPVYQEFLNLARGATRVPLSEELVQKGEQRKKLGQPPNSPGKTSIGDEVIWESLLQLRCRRLILVTRDRGFHGFKDVLQEEYGAVSGGHLHLTESMADAVKGLEAPPEGMVELAEDFDGGVAMRSGLLCPVCGSRQEAQIVPVGGGDYLHWYHCYTCRHSTEPQFTPPDGWADHQ